MNPWKKQKHNQGDPLFDSSSIRLLSLGSVAIVMALIVMIGASLFIVQNAVVEKIKTDDVGNLANSIGGVIEARVQRAVDASVLLANDPSLRQWLLQREPEGELFGWVEQQTDDLVANFDYSTVFLASNLTRNIWFSDGEKLEFGTVLSRDEPDDEWFYHSIAMNRKYAINIDYNLVLEDTFLFINTLVGPVGDPLGVTGVGMNLSEFVFKLIADEQQGQLTYSPWLKPSPNTHLTPG